MAVKVLDRGAGEGCNCITTFMIDTDADKYDLPTTTATGVCGDTCSAGSMAIVADTKSVLMINTEGVWV